MNKSRLILLLILVFAAVSIGVAWSLPTPSFTENADEFRLAFSVANFTNVLAIGTALLFLSGLAGFKQDIKTAYHLICYGLLVQSISTITYSVLSYVTPVERILVADLPLTIGAFLMLLGARRIARVLHVRSVFLSPVAIVLYLLAVSALMWIIPHNTMQPAGLLQANYVLEACIYLPTAWLLWRASKLASASYVRPFRLLIIAFAGNFIAAALFIGKVYVTYPDWASEELLGILFIIDTLVYVAAGYSFSSLQRRLLRQQKANSMVDIITFMASLVSRPQDVDPILDKLRVITAKLPAGQQLSPEQERQLSSIYVELEEYLVTREALRSFSRESIRSVLLHKFDRLPAGVAEATSENNK